MRPISFIYIFIITFFITIVSTAQTSSLSSGFSQKLATLSKDSKTVILADPNDPYYVLAEEISQFESFPIENSIDKAFDQNPVFLLWVVSPSYLSEQALIEFSMTIQNHSSAISAGIISGTTLEKARDLWQRSFDFKGESLLSANFNESRFIAFDGNRTATPLSTKEKLIQSLLNADYLTFAGGGGSGFWRLGRDTYLIAEDIPHLPTIVISTGVCQTFRLWKEKSIALRFTDQGAVSYAGFAHSPAPYYLFGDEDGFPYRYTFPDFPIGHIVQLQNQGAMQGFAHFPWFYLLGDPRMSFQAEKPYRLVEDNKAGEIRILHCTNAPAGFIPVHIPGGAEYSFIEIPSITASSSRDLFFNSRLQIIDINADKYILFNHKGGDFTVRLHKNTPWHWSVLDPFTDALDHVFLYHLHTQGSSFFLFITAIVLIPVAWFALRKKVNTKTILPSIVTGVCFSIFIGFYALARLDHATITTKMIHFSPLSVLEIFLLTACGAFLFLNSRSLLVKVGAILMATFPTWAIAAFWMGGIAIVNIFGSRPRMGVNLYNYAPGIMPIIAFIFELIIVLLVFSFLHRSIMETKRMNYN